MQKQNRTEVIDPVVDQAIAECADAVVDLQKKSFQPGLESFEQYAKKIRHKISAMLHDFHTACARGHKVLIDQIKKSSPELFGQEELQNTLYPSRSIDDPEAFMQALSEGASVYSLLGFSDEVMQRFYRAAAELLDEGKSGEAKEGFLFLTAIGPRVFEFWLGLGIAYTRLHELDSAIQALGQAIDIHPQDIDGYLALAHVYVQKQDFNQAQHVCDIGLSTVEAHKELPWAHELGAHLREVKQQLELMRNKSSSPTYLSE